MNYKWLGYEKIFFICLTLSLPLNVDRSAYAQGTIVFNNLGPNNGKVLVSASPGAFTPLNEDINFYLRVFGPGPVRVFERSWLLSDGTAKGINVGPDHGVSLTSRLDPAPDPAPGWLPIRTNFVSDEGSFHDEQAVLPHRFFRARLP